MHATWHSYVLVGLHSDNFELACPNLGAWMLMNFLMLIRVRSGSIARPKIETWQKLGNVSDVLPDLSPLSDSQNPFLAREPLSILYVTLALIKAFLFLSNHKRQWD